MEPTPPPRKLWEHPNPKSTAMYKFMTSVNTAKNLNLQTFNDLHTYALTHPSSFWALLLQDLHLIYTGTYTRVFDPSARMDSTPPWLEGISLNYSENILYTRSVDSSSTASRSTKGKEDSKIAATEIREGGKDVTHITWGQLRSDVAALASAMRNQGVQRGDRIALVGANSLDTMRVFLATGVVGGIFSSASTDMGVKGILDRVLQIEPRWLFMDDFAVYNGKTIDLRPKIAEVVKSLKTVKEFRGCVVIPRFQKPGDVAQIPGCQTLENFLGRRSRGKGRDLEVEVEFEFERVAFGDPVMIGYSSGTTGAPKCIVHSVGGLLVSGGKEGKYHHSINPDSRILQFTTTGWIMYLAQISSMLLGCTPILYDGSPFHPTPTLLLSLASTHKVTHLGISPRWLHEIQKLSRVPKSLFDLSSLQLVLSTGSILPERLFEWFYDVAFPPEVHLANMSGGTDIAGCFAMANPLVPLYAGGTQGPSLGIATEVYDSSLEGSKLPPSPVPAGIPGELVCTRPFPNMPLGFWGDTDRKKYLGSYFGKFENVWTHGDFVVVRKETGRGEGGGVVFLGRSDGVLNPSGVRFGSAELYNVVEGRFPQVLDSIAVGQRRPQDSDEQVLLFLKMKPGERFTQKLVNDLRAAIRAQLSARHVPAYIFETPEIPTTVNFKKVELPVKQIVSGKRIKPSETLANPGCLEFYYRFVEVEKLAEREKQKEGVRSKL